MYKIYLKDLKISGNIVELYKYLKKSITNISPNESIKFTKKIKKDLKNNFFEKLSNVEEFNNFNPKKNDFDRYKNELLKEMKLNSLNDEINKIINELVKLFMFFKDNKNYHKDFIKSNRPDLNNQFKKLIMNSQISYKKSLEKSIISFVLYLQSKLENINQYLLFKKVNDLINNKKKEDEINQFNILCENTANSIKTKIESHKHAFEIDINSFTEEVSQGKKDSTEIENFTSKWKSLNESIQEKIKSEIIEFASKIEEKINLTEVIEENEFEIQEKISYFNMGHITAHSVVLGIEGIVGGISAAFATTVSAPGVGIAIGVGILIHVGICVIRYKRKQKEERQKLIQSIFNYSRNFSDNLSVYQNSVLELIESQQTKIINQIKDKYLFRSIKLNENEINNFKDIIKIFEETVDNNFNFK